MMKHMAGGNDYPLVFIDFAKTWQVCKRTFSWVYNRFSNWFMVVNFCWYEKYESLLYYMERVNVDRIFSGVNLRHSWTIQDSLRQVQRSSAYFENHQTLTWFLILTDLPFSFVWKFIGKLVDVDNIVKVAKTGCKIRITQFQ